MTIFPYGPDLFEGHEIADIALDDPRGRLREWLDYPDTAEVISRMQRSRAIGLFGMETIGRQWASYLSGVPSARVLEPARA